MSRFKLTTISLILNILLIAAVTINAMPNYSATINSNNIVERIEQMWELSTVKYTYSGASGYQDHKQIADIIIPFTSKHFIFTYEGYITAGVNLEGVKVETTPTKVKIILPKAEILHSVIQEETIQIYDQSHNIINPILIEDFTQSLITEKELMEQKAIDKGILSEAEINAEKIIREVLSIYEIASVEVAFI